LLPTWLIGDGDKKRSASDLKIAFARLGVPRLPRLDLHGFDFVVDFAQPMLKFRGFHFHTDVAALADDVSFGGVFEFPHQQRVLEAAFRARDVYSFVFKHFPTSQQS
jgi:hypothetical protein